MNNKEWRLYKVTPVWFRIRPIVYRWILVESSKEHHSLAIDMTRDVEMEEITCPVFKAFFEHEKPKN